jgi:maleate isomerase
VAYDVLVSQLLESTGASRVTLRLDQPGEVFPVVAEACAPGVRSIRTATEIDLRAAKTFQYLEREHELLVQRDCLTDEPVAPQGLIELYGVRAQMLAPIVRDDHLVGIISVHHAATPRDWSPQEICLLERAAAEVATALDRAS